MKLPYIVVVFLLTGLFLLAGVNLADAQWDALSSGFAVTTNYHGKDVLIGQSVTATAGWAPALAPAGIRDIEVETVEFVWHFPNGTVAYTDIVGISTDSITTPNEAPPAPIPPEISEWGEKYPGVEYWYAQSTHAPTVLGDWGVQAIFHNTVRICGKNSETIRVRGTSFNVVPEVPFGTAVILLSWIGLLGVFAVRKKHLLA